MSKVVLCIVTTVVICIVTKVAVCFLCEVSIRASVALPASRVS